MKIRNWGLFNQTVTRSRINNCTSYHIVEFQLEVESISPRPVQPIGSTPRPTGGRWFRSFCVQSSATNFEMRWTAPRVTWWSKPLGFVALSPLWLPDGVPKTCWKMLKAFKSIGSGESVACKFAGPGLDLFLASKVSTVGVHGCAL